MAESINPIAAGRQNIAEQRLAFIKMAKEVFLKEGYSESLATKCAIENAPLDETSIFTEEGKYMVGTFSGTHVKVAKDLFPTVYSEPVHYSGSGYEGGVDGKKHTIVLADGTKLTFPHKPSDKQPTLQVEMQTNTWTIDSKTKKEIPWPHLQVDPTDMSLDINARNGKEQVISVTPNKALVTVKKDQNDVAISRYGDNSPFRVE